MLGFGRPFVLEMIDSRRALSVQNDSLKEMELKINESNDVKFKFLFISFHFMMIKG